MKNQVTLRDIAQEAGVSVATVSYVLNAREDQKIRAETRKKVLQIANLLGYTGNTYARSLVTGKSYCVGLGSGAGDFLSAAHCAAFTESFCSELLAHCYSLVFAPHGVSRANTDAVVCFNMPEHEFHKAAELTYSPIISVDALIHDPLFFSITTDYPALLESAAGALGGDPVFVGINYGCPRLKDRITSVFGSARFCGDAGELIDTAKELRRAPIVCDSPAVYEIVSSICTSVYYRDNNPQKAAAVFKFIQHGINRDYSGPHDITV